MKVTCVYKNAALDIVKEDNSHYYRCDLSLLGSPSRIIKNESLEAIVLLFKSHVSNTFKTGITSPFIQLEVRYKNEVLRIREYDPDTNKVTSYKTTYPKPEIEGNLDSLVAQFQLEVNKLNK